MNTAPLKIATYCPGESSLIKPLRNQFSWGNPQAAGGLGAQPAAEIVDTSRWFFPLLQSIFLSELHVAQNSSGRGGFQRATPPPLRFTRPPVYRGPGRRARPRKQPRGMNISSQASPPQLRPPQPLPASGGPGHGGATSADAITNRPGSARLGPARRARPDAARIRGKTQPKDKARGRRGRKRRCGLFFFRAFYLRGSWRSSPFCPQRTTPRRNWRGLATSATKGKAESTVRKRSCRVPLPPAGALRRRGDRSEQPSLGRLRSPADRRLSHAHSVMDGAASEWGRGWAAGRRARLGCSDPTALADWVLFALAE